MHPDPDLQSLFDVETVAEIVAEIVAVDAVEVIDLQQDECDSALFEIELLAMTRTLHILL